MEKSSIVRPHDAQRGSGLNHGDSTLKVVVQKINMSPKRGQSSLELKKTHRVIFLSVNSPSKNFRPKNFR